MLSSETVFELLDVTGRADPCDSRNLKNEHTTQRQGLGGAEIALSNGASCGLGMF